MPDCFADLSEMLLTEILALTGTATRVDFVADQHSDLSIKNTERSKRGRDRLSRRHKQSPAALPSPVEDVYVKWDQETQAYALSHK